MQQNIYMLPFKHIRNGCLTGYLTQWFSTCGMRTICLVVREQRSFFYFLSIWTHKETHFGNFPFQFSVVVYHQEMKFVSGPRLSKGWEPLI